MNKTKYKFQNFDFSVTVVLEVDHNIFTEEEAESINNFYGGREQRLNDAHGNVKLAVLKLIANALGRWGILQGSEVVFTDHEYIWREFEDTIREGMCYVKGIVVKEIDVCLDTELELTQTNHMN